MSGEAPMHPASVEANHENLVQALDGMGLKYDQTHGRHGEPERSAIVYNPSREQMRHLGKLFGQDSVVFSQGGKHELLYTNGEHEGKSRLTHPAQQPLEHFESPPEDFYTALPGNQGYFRINFDFEHDPRHQGPVQTHPTSPAAKVPEQVSTAPVTKSIISTDERSNEVTDKTYSTEEVAAILVKTRDEKIAKFEAEIKEWRTAELKKTIIPPHRHVTGTSAGSGAEDISGAAMLGKGRPMEDTPGEETSGERSPADVLDDAMNKDELCLNCGKKGHKLDKCRAMKAEMVDSKGKHISVGNNPSATMPDDGSKEVSAPGSGGQIVKKAEPPMAKPPSGKNMGASVPMSKDVMESAPGTEAGITAGLDKSAKVKPKLPKLAVKPLGKGVMADIALRNNMGAPAPAAPKVKLPSPAQHADRAADFSAAAAGAFTPKAPVVSGLELDKKPTPALASPKAAGITPKAPASKPGIFGKLLGKK